MAKREITIKKSATAEIGEGSVINVVRHGEHVLVKVGEGVKAHASATLSQKNASNLRFRVDGEVVGLEKGKYALVPFDMGKWTVRARWARQYPRDGWMAVVASTDENATVTVL